jgi:hypothetical protein
MRTCHRKISVFWIIVKFEAQKPLHLIAGFRHALTRISDTVERESMPHKNSVADSIETEKVIRMGSNIRDCMEIEKKQESAWKKKKQTAYR